MRDRTPLQAVLGVLEGLGLNYALVLDASGTQVETLMIVGAAGRTASAAPIRPPRSSRREVPEVEPEAPIVEADEPVEIEASIPAVPGEVAPVDEKTKDVPTPTLPGVPAFPGPLNPTIAAPGSSPFAPGPLPVPGPRPVFPGQPVPGQQPVVPGQQPVTPSPSPNPSTSH
jgi:hypothetical protein